MKRAAEKNSVSRDHISKWDCADLGVWGGKFTLPFEIDGLPIVCRRTYAGERRVGWGILFLVIMIGGNERFRYRRQAVIYSDSLDNEA